MALFRQRIVLAAIGVFVVAIGCTLLPVQTACAGGPFWSNDHDDESSPVGARQKCRHGKLWPPYPRPTGDEMDCSHIYHAAHYWPWPYNCFDRASVREFSELQVANGWIAEATLYDYHFEPGTQTLNQAGQMHLQWILTSVPPDRRAAWVQATVDSAISQQRIQNVRNQAVVMVGEENVPPIMVRVDMVQGRPAAEIDRIRRTFVDGMPAPRIVYQRPLFTQ